MKHASNVLLAGVFCFSSVSKASDLTDAEVSREIVRCISSVNLNGYVVSVFERSSKTFMKAEKCFIWRNRCYQTEADFGTFEVTRIYGSYEGRDSSLLFDTGDDSVVFDNYKPPVTIKFGKDQCKRFS